MDPKVNLGTSQETETSLRKPCPGKKADIQTIHRRLASLVKNYHGIIELSTPHRSETTGIAERAVRRVKEGTSAVLLQSGLVKKWWADAMECYCYLRNVQGLPGRR